MTIQAATAVISQVALACQFSLGIVFVFASLPKLRHPLAFAESVAGYEILPRRTAWVFALGLIPIEAFLGAAFLIGWRLDAALPLAAAALTAFALAVGINVRRGRRILCECFGNRGEYISIRTLTRLLLLLGVVVFLLVFRSVDGSLTLTLGSLDALTLMTALQAAFLGVALIVLAAWLLSLPELILLVRRLRWSESSTSTATTGKL